MLRRATALKRICDRQRVQNAPRCVLQYGAMARVDMKRKIIKCEVM